jgi:pimeloyl-ACP methyl ester carboxylesterase
MAMKAFTRRSVTGVLALAAATIVPPAHAQNRLASKTYVLVHGAWHGGWCWRRVSDLLEQNGHKVFSPTLTGLGERSHLLSRDVNLETHVTDVANVIKWEGLTDIVLVAHSYSGMVATALTERVGSAISSLVLLDAFYPAVGDSLASLASEKIRQGILDDVAKGEWLAKPIPAATFKVNEKDRAWVDSLCTPHPLSTFVEKTVSTAAREKVGKKTHIRATGSPSLPFDTALKQTRADSTWKTYELPCGHDVMVDMPEQLFAILLERA